MALAIAPNIGGLNAGLFAKMNGVFFDADLVKRTVKKSKRKMLLRFGAFLRIEARSSIRKRKKTSDVGKPPSSHRGWLKQHLYFSWDARTESIVVGPIPLGRGTAPRALEEGGPSLSFRRFKAANGQWMTAIREVHIRARPYMGPALKRIIPKFAGLMRGMVVGGSVIAKHVPRG